MDESVYSSKVQSWNGGDAGFMSVNGPSLRIVVCTAAGSPAASRVLLASAGCYVIRETSAITQ